MPGESRELCQWCFKGSRPPWGQGAVEVEQACGVEVGEKVLGNNHMQQALPPSSEVPAGLQVLIRANLHHLSAPHLHLTFSSMQ